MTKIKGRDISLSMEVDGGGEEIVGYARDCSIEVQCDVQEFTSPLSGRGKRNRAGRYGWSVQIETLIGDSEQPYTLLTCLKSGAVVTLILEAKLYNGGRYYLLRGDAVVQSCSEKAPLQGLATFSASFIGDGELNLVTERIPTPTPRP